MALTWTLSDIITKVRNVTGTPSSDQLTDSQITDYVNAYYVYTMPFELKEQIQLEFLKFTTTAAQDVYSFPGIFLTDQPMAYADGFPLIFYQDPDIFYQDWPQQVAVNNLASGNGVTVTFSGGLQNPPIIIGTVTITDGTQIVQDNGSSTISQTIAFGNGTIGPYTGTLGAFPILAGSMTVTNGVENFTDNGAGVLTGSAGGTGTINYTTGVFSVTFNAAVVVGVAITSTYTVNVVAGVGVLSGNGAGTINYLTGAFSVTFNSAPVNLAPVYAKYQGYQPDRPQGVLFFNNQFTFRPVPDQVYQIQMQGYINPTALTNAALGATLPEWGPLIAYGASLEIFADRGDQQKYGEYYNQLKRYENVALARTVQQFQAEQRCRSLGLMSD